MIVKEIDAKICNDKKTVAGFKAEEKMAYYLMQKYIHDDNIFVFNDLRFKYQDLFHQIDHLILSKYGLIVIESKSISTKIRYNDNREWSFWTDKGWEGIPNPVVQAETQGKALKELLRKHRAGLLGKLLLMQKGFAYMPVEYLVAISAQCNEIIRGKKDIYCKNVFKADLISNRLDEIFADYKNRRRKILSPADLPWSISKEETINVKNFILQQHIPLESKQKNITKRQFEQDSLNAQNSRKESDDVEKIRPLEYCPTCNNRLSIEWRDSYKNYCWFCTDCRKNIPVKYQCPQCRNMLKLRKNKNEFYIYCKPCTLEAFYFANEI